MFALLRACERGPEDSAVIEDAKTFRASCGERVRKVEELAEVSSEQGEEAQAGSSEEVIAGLSPHMEAAAKALQFNMEQFYHVWDPKMGTPEVDVADLILQCQKLNGQKLGGGAGGAGGARRTSEATTESTQAPLESTEDDFLARFSEGENPGTAATVAAAVAEEELEAHERAKSSSATPDLAAFGGEDSPERVWIVNIAKPEGSKAAGVRVHVPEGRFHALKVLEIMDGPFKAWNAANPEQAMQVGDEIVEVNGQMGSGAALLERIRQDPTLCMAVQRRRRPGAPKPKPAAKSPSPAQPATPGSGWSFSLPKCAKGLLRRSA